MEGDFVVRRLVEFMSATKANVDEIFDRYPPLPAIFFEKGFLRNFKSVLHIRRLVVLRRWPSLLETCYKKMLSSHQMYLTYIMHTCFSEQEYHKYIFEKFLSVMALVLNCTAVTYEKVKVDFNHLNPVIFAVFYYSEMEGKFCRAGGFRQFVKYINSHKLARDKRNKYPFSDDDDLIKILNDEETRDPVTEKVIDPDGPSKDIKSVLLADKVLSIPQIDLPTLPSYNDIVMSLVAHKKQDIKAKQEAKEGNFIEVLKSKAFSINLQKSSSSISDSKTNYRSKVVTSATPVESEDIWLPSAEKVFPRTSVEPSTSTSEPDPIKRLVPSKEKKMAKVIEIEKRIQTLNVDLQESSNSDFKTNYAANDPENIAYFEEIIQTVIKHNDSKKSGREDASNQIQKEAGVVLEDLKTTIKSLIEILDKSDEE